VVVGVLMLSLLPAVVRHWPLGVASIAPDELARRIRASAAQPFSGNVATVGRLGLPDIPRLDNEVSLLGETSRLRTWYAGPTSWRVDMLSLTGEHDMYSSGNSIVTWDSADRRAERTVESGQLHLPRPADMLPPQLGRMFVGAATPQELRPLEPVRVAGRAVPGLRIVPAAEVSTIDHVDVWADAGTGLPLRVAVTARGGTFPLVESQFLDVSLARPDPSSVTFSPAAGVSIQRPRRPDPLQQALRRAPVPLPDQIAGLPRLTPPGAGVAVYGRGFVVVVAAAVPPDLLNSVLPRLVETSKRPWGAEVKLIQTPMVNLMAGTLADVGYLLAGPVTVAELDRIVSSVAAGAGAST
jgi:hypothetical protein